LFCACVLACPLHSCHPYNGAPTPYSLGLSANLSWEASSTLPTPAKSESGCRPSSTSTQHRQPSQRTVFPIGPTLLYSNYLVAEIMSTGKEKSAERPPVASGRGNNQFLTQPAHALSGEAVVSQTGANLQDGLSAPDARQRLSQYGPNELADGGGVQPFKILIRQIANAMTLVRSPLYPTPPS